MNVKFYRGTDAKYQSTYTGTTEVGLKYAIYFATDTHKIYMNSNSYSSAADVSNFIDTSKLGVANGVATLDSSGMVPSTQLPSYVDDIVSYDSTSNFPTTGEVAKIYVETTNNEAYRWNGSAYTKILTGNGNLTLGTTSTTAFAGDKGNETYTWYTNLTGGSQNSSRYFVDLDNANYDLTIGTDSITLVLPTENFYNPAVSQNKSNVFPAATTTTAGIMTSTDKTNLTTATTNITTIQSQLTWNDLP